MASTYLTRRLSEKSNIKELRGAVASLAKTANQRLRELEKQGLANQSSAYGWVERKWTDHTKSGGKKEPYIGTTSKIIDGKLVELPKFSTNTRGKTAAQLAEEVEELQQFLGAKTSRVKGTREVLDKSLKAYQDYFQQQHGVEISPDDWNDYWSESALWSEYNSAYGYEEMERVMSEAGLRKLSAKEAEKILRAAGFATEDGYKAIPLAEVDRAFQRWDALPQSVKPYVQSDPQILNTWEHLTTAEQEYYTTHPDELHTLTARPTL